MEDITKQYTNSDITVHWQPSKCVHSTLCWKGLIEVFNPRERPWIKMEGASTEAIVAQVDKCPSGALSYRRNQEKDEIAATASETVVEVIKDGPLLVYGNITVQRADGSITHQHKVTAFCRCGASSNKPFCDGTHIKIGFKHE